MKQKELTYLELPPDEQKVTKRPDTNRISDKDRIATSRAPQLDRKELKKILDSARPGPPSGAGAVAARRTGSGSPGPASRAGTVIAASTAGSEPGGAPADSTGRTAGSEFQYGRDVGGIGH